MGSRWSNVLRSALTLNNLTDPRQVSKLDQLITLQGVAINTHETSSLTHTLLGWAWTNSDMPLFSGPACFNSRTTEDNVDGRVKAGLHRLLDRQ